MPLATMTSPATTPTSPSIFEFNRPFELPPISSQTTEPLHDKSSSDNNLLNFIKLEDMTTNIEPSTQNRRATMPNLNISSPFSLKPPTSSTLKSSTTSPIKPASPFKPSSPFKTTTHHPSSLTQQPGTKQSNLFQASTPFQSSSCSFKSSPLKATSPTVKSSSPFHFEYEPSASLTNLEVPRSTAACNQMDTSEPKRTSMVQGLTPNTLYNAFNQPPLHISSPVYDHLMHTHPQCQPLPPTPPTTSQNQHLLTSPSRSHHSQLSPHHHQHSPLSQPPLRSPHHLFPSPTQKQPPQPKASLLERRKGNKSHAQPLPKLTINQKFRTSTSSTGLPSSSSSTVGSSSTCFITPDSHMNDLTPRTSKKFDLITPKKVTSMSNALDELFAHFYEQTKTPLHSDPVRWTSVKVKHWAQWIEKEFAEISSKGIISAKLNGDQLNNLPKEEFLKLWPPLIGEIPLNHWEFLKDNYKKSPHKQAHALPTLEKTELEQKLASSLQSATGGGPVQLWHFLIELLLDRSKQNLIGWTGRGWEFKIIEPDEVALLWGQKKNKPKMNYEKLSRGLRYYYDKNLLEKTPGRRYVYNFTCDLAEILKTKPEDMHKALGTVPESEEGSSTRSVARSNR